MECSGDNTVVNRRPEHAAKSISKDSDEKMVLISLTVTPVGYQITFHSDHSHLQFSNASTLFAQRILVFISLGKLTLIANTKARLACFS